MNKRLPRVKAAKYQLQTVGAVLIVLKLFKEIAISWLVVLFPFLFLAVFELSFFLIGIIMYHTNKR